MILTREFKHHVYGKRQTSDSSWEFLKITAQNNSDLWTKICVKQLIYVLKRQVEGGKLGHMVQIRVYLTRRKRDA